METTFPALLAFAFVSSVTPGPNNLMLMASGGNFGVRRTVPHMLGVAIGFTVMIVLVGVGVVGLFNLWPMSYAILKYVSIAYMVWLAWKIANAAAPGSGAAGAKPMTFVQAALFQWVNPKAWTMALTAVTVYAAGGTLAAIVVVALVFGAINLPSVASWAVMGQVMRRWLSSPARLRAFNWGMAALLLGSLALAV